MLVFKKFKILSIFCFLNDLVFITMQKIKLKNAIFLFELKIFENKQK